MNIKRIIAAAVAAGSAWAVSASPVFAVALGATWS